MRWFYTPGSVSVKAVAYTSFTHQLHVQFHGSKDKYYTYSNVDPELFGRICSMRSTGHAVARLVKDNPNIPAPVCNPLIKETVENDDF